MLLLFVQPVRACILARTTDPAAEHHEAKSPLRRPGKVEAGLRRRDRVAVAERVRVGIVAVSACCAVGRENPDGWWDPVGEGEGELTAFLQRCVVGRQCIFGQHDLVRVHEVAVNLGDSVQIPE